MFYYAGFTNLVLINKYHFQQTEVGILTEYLCPSKIDMLKLYFPIGWDLEMGPLGCI